MLAAVRVGRRRGGGPATCAMRSQDPMGEAFRTCRRRGIVVLASGTAISLSALTGAITPAIADPPVQPVITTPVMPPHADGGGQQQQKQNKAPEVAPAPPVPQAPPPSRPPAPQNTPAPTVEPAPAPTATAPVEPTHTPAVTGPPTVTTTVASTPAETQPPKPAIAASPTSQPTSEPTSAPAGPKTLAPKASVPPGPSAAGTTPLAPPSPSAGPTPMLAPAGPSPQSQAATPGPHESGAATPSGGASSVAPAPGGSAAAGPSEPVSSPSTSVSQAGKVIQLEKAQTLQAPAQDVQLAKASVPVEQRPDPAPQADLASLRKTIGLPDPSADNRNRDDHDWKPPTPRGNDRDDHDWDHDHDVRQWDRNWVQYDQYYRPVLCNPYHDAVRIVYVYQNQPRIVWIPPLASIVLDAIQYGAYSFTALVTDAIGTAINVAVGSFFGGGYYPGPFVAPP